mmetsp:Transcript_91642/g.143841  ORF Transcript_91642/g.143841 Transcript_91642/m.143841 type:complete len:352 (-) Transcript_91642:24-1079(-)
MRSAPEIAQLSCLEDRFSKENRSDLQPCRSGQSNSSEWESLAEGPFQPRSPRDKGDAMTPLLKASPPTRVGSKVGRYRIRIWRATTRQPFGINFVLSDGKIKIGEDVVHLGLREGDELVRANHLNATRSDECRQLLAESTCVDLLLHHRELLEDVAVKDQDASWSWNPFQRLSRRQEAGEDGDPQCCRSARSADRDDSVQPLQVLLAVTKPTIVRTTQESFEDAIEFEISVQRSSLKQRLGVDFALEPQLPTMSRQTPPKILIAQDAYSLGLRRGDQVLLVNGVPYSRAADCRKMFETASLVNLRLKRLSSPDGFVQVAMAPEIEDSSEVVTEVVYVDQQPGGSGCGILCR